MLNTITDNIKNIPGWKTSRKLMIIESDDWGSIRMPNATTYKELLDQGIRVDKNKFTRLDTLGSSSDLDALYTVLSEVKDANDNSAVFTPFINVANPDFVKIAQSGYQEYVMEHFDQTLTRAFGGGIMDKWHQGIKSGVFTPEYHGREHFNVPLLMRMLKEDVDGMRFAFDRGVVHIPLQKVLPVTKGLAPTCYYEDADSMKYIQESLVDGVKIFSEVLGYEPVSFMPPNGVFNDQLERSLYTTSLKGIVVNRERPEPQEDGSVANRSFRWKFGKRNNGGQTYYIRNCKFEPVQNSYSLDKTLSQIGSAFRWGKPAIISSHRINFVGSIDNKHQIRSLEELRKLLKQVVKTWPDVEFVSAKDLLKIMRAD